MCCDVIYRHEKTKRQKRQKMKRQASSLSFILLAIKLMTTICEEEFSEELEQMENLIFKAVSCPDWNIFCIFIPIQYVLYRYRYIDKLMIESM